MTPKLILEGRVPKNDSDQSLGQFIEVYQGLFYVRSVALLEEVFCKCFHLHCDFWETFLIDNRLQDLWLLHHLIQVD